MLLRVALVASVFSAFVLAAEPPATPVFSGQVFPDQDKSLTQLTRQALDKQVGAAVTGKQPSEAPNPTRMPYRRFVLPSERARPLGGKGQIAQAFPRFCSIPLLEAKVPEATDPMAKPTGKTSFDQIGKASPVPVCKNWQ